jgi:hypothetical protein
MMKKKSNARAGKGFGGTLGKVLSVVDPIAGLVGKELGLFGKKKDEEEGEVAGSKGLPPMRRGGRAKKDIGSIDGNNMMGRADRKGRKAGGRATVASPLSQASSGTPRPQTKKSY